MRSARAVRIEPERWPLVSVSIEPEAERSLDIMPGSVLGLKSGNKTRGHRFLSRGVIAIGHARDYEKITLQDSELIIELNLGYKKSLTQWNASWVRVKDPESLYDRKKDLVILESGTQTISIGQFILAEKRHDLAKEIRQALRLCLH